MPSDPAWLVAADLIALNLDVVTDTGEDHAVINPNGLESAVARPQNRFVYTGDRDVVRLAVALLAGIAQNHPFLQGNKRTAARAALDFMSFNGFSWEMEDDGTYAHWIVALVGGELTEPDLAARMRPHVRPAGPRPDTTPH